MQLLWARVVLRQAPMVLAVWEARRAWEVVFFIWVGEAFNNAQLKNWTLSASQGFGPSTMFLPGATHKFDFTNISEPLAAPARFYYSGSNPWTHTLATTGQCGVYELTGLLDFPDFS